MTTTATSFEEPRMEIGRAAPPLHRALIALGNQVELDRAYGNSSTCAPRS